MPTFLVPGKTYTTLPGKIYTNAKTQIKIIDKMNNSSIFGVFSLKKLSSSYTGPQVNIRRGTDNSTNDFYGTMDGTILTDSSGMSLMDWLAGATGYVRVLYNQTGGVNNFANYVNGTTQPTISTTDNVYYIVFAGSQTLSYQNTSGVSASITIADASFSFRIIPTSVTTTLSPTTNQINWYQADSLLYGERGGITNDFSIIMLRNPTPSFCFGTGKSGTDRAFPSSGTGTSLNTLQTITFTRLTASGVVSVYNGTTLLNSSAGVGNNSGDLVSLAPLQIGRGGLRTRMSGLILSNNIFTINDINAINSDSGI